MPHTQKTVLFTTGSTVTFKEILREITTPDFVSSLKEALGVTNMIVQYGNEHDEHTGRNLSEEFFNACLEENNLLQELGLQNVTLDHASGTTLFETGDKRFLLEVFPYSTELRSYMENADLVVSHAGTGTVIDVLRAHKPLIVVTNPKLMHDHQTEVADQLVRGNYCKKVNLDDTFVEQLLTTIKVIGDLGTTFATFPAPATGVLDMIIRQELGQ